MRSPRELIIGSRGSVLALWQANYIKDRMKNELGLESRIVVVKTQGDRILDVPLAKIGGKGLFTKELEEKLLCREIDLAVHSLKDVPIQMHEDLGLCCISKREDPRDCFLSFTYKNLSSLPKNGRVGTTSLRRGMQIKSIFPYLDTQSLRGNVHTRLKRLRDGNFDAIILARAAVNRLNLFQDISYVQTLELEDMVPAMGQGALGVQARLDSEVFSLLSKLHDEDTGICVSAERAFVGVFDGGCQVPMGVHATIREVQDYPQNSNNLRMNIGAILGLPDGSIVLKDNINCAKLEGMDAALRLADNFIQRGAKDILDRARNWEL